MQCVSGVPKGGGLEVARGGRWAAERKLFFLAGRFFSDFSFSPKARTIKKEKGHLLHHTEEKNKQERNTHTHQERKGGVVLFQRRP